MLQCAASMGFESDTNFPPGLAREDRYILHNYYRLSSWADRCMHRLRLAQLRGDTEVCTRMKERLARLWRPTEPAMARLETLPLAEFLHEMAQRIRQEHSTAIQWRRCPSCGGLARTPRARLCPECGKGW